MLIVDFAQISDAGKVREQNEDRLGHYLPETREKARTHGWLFVIADGVGGQEKGEVASQTAVENLIAGFRQAPKEEPHAALLTRLIQQANTRIYEAGHSISAERVAMATTVVACALRFDRAVIAHVGDSRCYLIRGGQAIQLTRDHTVTSEQVRLGILSTGEADKLPTRHFLSRSVGNDLFVSVDTREVAVQRGDVLLLCSDGLHGAIPGSEMARIVSHNVDPKRAAEELVTIANQQDGSDNISIQLIHVQSVERVGMYRGRPYRLR